MNVVRMSMLFAAVVVVASPLTAWAGEDEVWNKISGEWKVDFDATAALPEIKEEDKAKIRAAAQNGLAISMTVKKPTADVLIAVPNQDKQNILAQWKILADDDMGASLLSTTGANQEKKEKVTIDYLAGGALKFKFADMEYPLVVRQAPPRE